MLFEFNLLYKREFFYMYQLNDYFWIGKNMLTYVYLLVHFLIVHFVGNKAKRVIWKGVLKKTKYAKFYLRFMPDV